MDRRIHWVLLGAIISISAVLRILFLGSESLWFDEYWTIQKSTGTVRSVIRGSMTDVHPPGYYLMMNGWIQLAGLSEVALRTPSAVFGILETAAVYAVGKRLYDRRTAMLAAMLIAVSLFHVRYAQEARMYAMLGLFTVVSFYFFLRLNEGYGPIYVGYLLSSGLLLYTHIYGIFAVIAQNLIVAAAILGCGRPWEIRPWVAIQSVLAILFLPWVGVFLNQITTVGAGGAASGWIPDPSVFVLGATFIHFVGSLVFVPLLFGVILVYLIDIDALRRFRSTESSLGLPIDLSPSDLELLIWFGSIVLLPFLLSYVVFPIYWSRFAIGGAAALTLLFARALVAVEIPTSQIRQVPIGNWLLIILVVIGSLGLLAPYYGTDQKVQWDEAASVVETRAVPGDVVLVSSPVFRYYFDRQRVTTAMLPADSTELREHANEHRRVWVLYVHFGDSSATQALISDGLSGTHKARLHRTFVASAGPYRGFNGEGTLELYLFVESPD